MSSQLFLHLACAHTCTCLAWKGWSRRTWQETLGKPNVKDHLIFEFQFHISFVYFGSSSTITNKGVNNYSEFHFITIGYHLEVQANPENSVQKNYAIFSIYGRNEIIPWHFFFNFHLGLLRLLRSNDNRC